jgi:transposase-like protein
VACSIATKSGRAMIEALIDGERRGPALEAFAGQWEGRYPAIVKLWRAHWNEFTPFLAFPPEVRRVIYTTKHRVDERPAAQGHP